MRRRRKVVVRTPFGAPSDAITVGELEGGRSPSCPATGRGTVFPSQINYRARRLRDEEDRRRSDPFDFGRRQHGRERIRRRDIVAIDQFFDHTR